MLSVLSHELSHVRHGDCMIATLLQFPIWVVNLIRIGVAFARQFLTAVFSGLAEIMAGFGIVGLFAILGMLALILYLGYLGLIMGVAVFICVFFINAFQREREYLADLYAAQILGTARPMMTALDKLEQAVARVRETLEKRGEEQAEEEEQTEEANLAVEAPTQAFVAGKLIRESLQNPPSFWRSFSEGEHFSDHPLSSNRIYYLENPLARKRVFSRIHEWLGRQAHRLLAPAGDVLDKSGKPAVYAGLVMGLIWTILGALPSLWLWDVLLFVGDLGVGIALGIFARRYRWSGELFVRSMIIAAFVSATSLLALGPLVRNELAAAFFLVFFWDAILFSAAAIATVAILRKKETRHG
jgi:Zn-dependent protease with chaperone function